MDEKIFIVLNALIALAQSLIARIPLPIRRRRNVKETENDPADEGQSRLQ